MQTVKTTRVRSEWVAELLEEFGTISAIADEMGVDKSTASRWLSGDGEATGRFVGTVLLTFPITFDDAFVAVEEIAQRRRARVYRHATGIQATDAA